MTNTIPFVDLAAQRQRLEPGLARAIEKVLTHGQFILGPEVADLERALAHFAGVRHAVTCANGTDALVLVLRALDIGPGDAVIVPAFTFVATAEAVCLVGATPILCDVRSATYDLDTESAARGLDHANRLGLKPRALIPVDLFGLPADYDTLGRLAADAGALVIADAAQSFGARACGRRIGGLARATTTSFFPAKPLGCYGDGGAILTDDDSLAALLRSLRFHGKGGHKYDNERIGYNSRLDTLQAAILLEKLTIFGHELEQRRSVADRYDAALGSDLAPRRPNDRTSAWAQYTMQLDNRDEVAAALTAQGIPTAVYYPRPLNRQTGYAHCPVAPGGVPVSERLSATVLSLPMHPYLSAGDQERITGLVRMVARPATPPRGAA
jgi:dTDP-4-amino-4,6-dideoxygalactose transaminase